MEEKIGKIVKLMREYQSKNGIKKACVTNTQYLYNKIVGYTDSKVRVIPVIVISNEKGKTKIVIHLVVSVDEELIIDPSYDVYRLKNKKYYVNIKDFICNVGNKTEEIVKKIISEYIDFKKISERINKGELLMYNKDQEEYIDKNM